VSLQVYGSGTTPIVEALTQYYGRCGHVLIDVADKRRTAFIGRRIGAELEPYAYAASTAAKLLLQLLVREAGSEMADGILALMLRHDVEWECPWQQHIDHMIAAQTKLDMQ